MDIGGLLIAESIVLLLVGTLVCSFISERRKNKRLLSFNGQNKEVASKSEQIGEPVITVEFIEDAKGSDGKIIERTYRAADKNAALEFLKRQVVSSEIPTITVLTSDGAYSKDTKHIYINREWQVPLYLICAFVSGNFFILAIFLHDIFGNKGSIAIAAIGFVGMFGLFGYLCGLIIPMILCATYAIFLLVNGEMMRSPFGYGVAFFLVYVCLAFGNLLNQIKRNKDQRLLKTKSSC